MLSHLDNSQIWSSDKHLQPDNLHSLVHQQQFSCRDSSRNWFAEIQQQYINSVSLIPNLFFFLFLLIQMQLHLVKNDAEKKNFTMEISITYIDLVQPGIIQCQQKYGNFHYTVTNFTELDVIINNQLSGNFYNNIKLSELDMDQAIHPFYLQGRYNLDIHTRRVPVQRSPDPDSTQSRCLRMTPWG